MRRRFAFALFALLALGPARPAAAKPVLFPPLPDGTQELRDERDVAPYLGAWKAHSLARQRAAAEPMTANQQQWNVTWYDLNLTFTPAGTQVSGTVRMKAVVTTGPISAVELDFGAHLILDGATSGGFAASTSRAGAILTVNLDRAYAVSEVVDVTVTYHGNPTVGGYFGFNTVNGRQLIWSLSEAYGARMWWPCKDAPEDKADSVDIRFTCPVALTVASNGTFVSRVAGATTATTTWRERHAITTYLVSIAAYPYTVTTDWYHYTPTDSMLIQFHNYPESVAAYAPVQALVNDMLEAFAGPFGEYPFLDEKYGHAQFQFGGGMEHQTCTSLGVANESVVAHELGHQWWGDLVTCRDFHHIWLNEGFATFSEAVWWEALGGPAAYHDDINLNKFFGAGSVWVPDATDETRVFDSNLSYNKGSWVLHMLRHVLGDATFFASLAQYRATWGHASATTEDFRDVCEQVSGRDLDAYFQQWVYGEYYPIYRPTWTAAAAGGGFDVTLTLEQVQSWQLFNMPVDVRITTSGGDVNFVVPDSLASQQFVLHVDDAPTAVAIDPDGWILKQLDQPITNPTFQKSVLLVNGVDWATYGAEITSAYTDQAFSGAYEVDFWDHFDEPVGGYPAPLPAATGHGPVPPDTMAQYRNVIWVGNNFNGDLASWQESPILNYLRAGGNLLLMTRQGSTFLGDSLKAYLGINWTTTSATLSDCIATRPGLTNITPLTGQNLNSVFDTVRTTPESELLFRAQAGFTPTRGIGAIRMPVNGAGYRPHGGRFAFLSGRPYRWNHTQLKNNVTAILSAWFLEPLSGVGVQPESRTDVRVALAPARPNPSSDLTALRFSQPREGHVRLTLMDVQGRRTRELLDEYRIAGEHEVVWNGRDDAGGRAAAGLYWARLEAGGEVAVRRLVRLP